MNFNLDPIKDDDSTAMKISKILFAEFPELHKGDPIEVTKAACALSDVLGCVLALLAAQLDTEDIIKLKAAVQERIDKSQSSVVEGGMAMREARSASMQ